MRDLRNFVRSFKATSILVLIAIALSFTQFSLISLIILVGAWTFASARLLGKRFYGSYLSHWALSLLVFMTINSLIAMACRILDASVPLWLITLINSLLIGGALYIAQSFGNNKQKENVSPHWVLIGLTLLIGASFTLPLIAKPTAATFMHYSAFGYDDAAHIQMFRGNIAANGYIYNLDKEKNPELNIESAVTSYPQGLHFNLSLFARGFLQLKHTDFNNIHYLLETYRLGMAVVYLGLIALLAEVMAQALSYFRKEKKKLGLISQLGLGVTLFLAFNTLIYPQISYAGQSFLATVAMLAGALLGLLVFKNTEEKLVRHAAFAIAAICTVGAAYTWILSLIVALAALLVFAWEKPPVLSNRRDILTRNWTWAYICLAVLASLPQIAILLLDTNTGVNSLTNDGGIASPDHGRYLTLAIVAIAGTIVACLQKKSAFDNKKVLDLSIVLLSPLLLVLFFYAVQTALTGQLSYYYTKSTYLGYIFLLCFTGVILTHLVSLLENIAGFLKTVYIGLILFGVLAIFTSAGRGFLVYAKGNNGAYVAKNVTDKAGQLIDQGVRPKNIISYTQRTYEEDMIFNLLTDKLDQYRSQERHDLSIMSQQKRYETFKTWVGNYSTRGDRVYILVSQHTRNEVLKAMPKHGDYQVITVD